MALIRTNLFRVGVLGIGGITLWLTSEAWQPLVVAVREWTLFEDTASAIPPVSRRPATTGASSPAPDSSRATVPAPEPAQDPRSDGQRSAPSREPRVIAGPLAKALAVAPPSPNNPPPPAQQTGLPPKPKRRPDYKIVGFTRGANRAVILDLRGEQQRYHVLDPIPGWGTLVSILSTRIQVKTDDQDLETLTYQPIADLDLTTPESPDPGLSSDPTIAPPSISTAPSAPAPTP